MNINISVNNKVARQTNDTPIVLNNTDYVAVFTFDGEWDSFTIKTARFSTDESYTDIQFSGNQCSIPAITNASYVRIGVYAGNTHTTTAAYVDCVNSIFTGTPLTLSGNNTSGNTSGGNTSGGNTSGGNTSGGNTSGGNTSGSTVTVTPATDNEIASRSATALVTASVINKSVTAALTDTNHLTLDSTQKETALGVLGAASSGSVTTVSNSVTALGTRVTALENAPSYTPTATTDNEISSRTSTAVLTGSAINKVVKAALTDSSKMELTSEEKTTALGVLGAASTSSVTSIGDRVTTVEGKLTDTSSSDISARTSGTVLTAAAINGSVKAALTDTSHITLDSSEKAIARGVIGAASSSVESSVNAIGNALTQTNSLLGVTYVANPLNLFDKNSTDLIIGKFYYNNTETICSEYNTSPLIKLNGVGTYWAVQTDGQMVFQLYDEDKQYLSSSSTGLTGRIEITDTSAKYIRFALWATDTDTCMFTKSDTRPTQYHAYSVDTVGGLETLDNIKSDIRKRRAGSQWLGQRALLLGDSITWYDGHAFSGQQTIARGYPTHLKNLGFDQIVNKGVSGMSMAANTVNNGVLSTYVNSLTLTGYQLITIAIGVNDWQYNIPIEDFEAAYLTCCTKIMTDNPTCTLVLCTPLPCSTGNTENSVGKKVSDYADSVRNFAKQYGLKLIDQYRYAGMTVENASYYTIDGLHPNNAGFKMVCDYFNTEINNIEPNYPAMRGYRLFTVEEINALIDAKIGQ